MFKQIILLIFFSFFLSLDVSAGEKELKLVYKIEYINLDESMQFMKAMLPNKQIIYIKDNKTLIVLAGSKAGDQQYLIDNTSGKVFLLMNVMGKKVAMESDLNELYGNNVLYKGLEHKELDEDKEIAGVKCKKVNLAMPDGTLGQAFYAPSIKRHKGYKDLPLNNLPGIAMEFTQTLSDKMFSITAKHTCLSISEKEIDEFISTFVLPDEEENSEISESDNIQSFDLMF